MPSSEDTKIDAATEDMTPLQRAATSGTISMTPEIFEAMYGAPLSKVKGELRGTLGNPTPVGLAGFLLAYTPLIISLMGWRGSGAQGAATVPIYYFFGGLLAILASIGEWILNNTFPSTFFAVYGGFFFYYGATFTPWFNSIEGGGGATSTIFLASNAYVGLFMGLFSIYATICALRINILYVLAFGLLVPTFLVNAAGQWYGAEGDMIRMKNYAVAAGAVGFPVAIIGWYLLLEIMLASVDFPLTLPVGDLSTFIPSRSDLRKSKKEKKARGSSSA